MAGPGLSELARWLAAALCSDRDTQLLADRSLQRAQRSPRFTPALLHIALHPPPRQAGAAAVPQGFTPANVAQQLQLAAAVPHMAALVLKATVRQRWRRLPASDRQQLKAWL